MLHHVMLHLGGFSSGLTVKGYPNLALDPKRKFWLLRAAHGTCVWWMLQRGGSGGRAPQPFASRFLAYRFRQSFCGHVWLAKLTILSLSCKPNIPLLLPSEISSLLCLKVALKPGNFFRLWCEVLFDFRFGCNVYILVQCHYPAAQAEFEFWWLKNGEHCTLTPSILPTFCFGLVIAKILCLSEWVGSRQIIFLSFGSGKKLVALYRWMKNGECSIPSIYLSSSSSWMVAKYILKNGEHYSFVEW
jgi:hypothetical protein